MTKQPLSTYRVQLHVGFKIQQLHQQLEYLHALGIDWIYASPVLAATAGSTHGYDQIDPSRLNPELGTEAEWRALHEHRRALGMGWLQDIVPNHMAYSLENPWVREILTHGEASTAAKHFDIDWRHPDFRGRVMLPILGDELTEVIAAGQVALTPQADGIQVYDQVLPLSSRSLGKFPDLQSAKLADVLDAQHYALTFWKTTNSTINYRRFFTVNGLICLRAERPETFAATHELIIEWLGRGDIDGVRIDHIDGLLDPTGYLKRLREAVGPEPYIVVEKILEHGETLPQEWPIEGSSGYDFMAHVNQLLRHPAGHAAVTATARHFTEHIGGSELPVDLQVFGNKLRFLRASMAGELENLVHHAQGALAGLPLGMDQPLLRETVAEWLAGFPVYRAYVRFGSFSESDRSLLVHAIDRAVALGAVQTDGLQRLRSWLRSITRLDDRTATFLQRAMQLSGPLMAKGIEDTTFYQHVDYLASNEVGDNPDIAYALSVEGWHDRMVERAPTELNAGSTHDTKRGEDARARLHALSADPASWTAFAKTAYDRLPAGEPLPGDTFLLLLQSLLGAWPSRMADAGNGDSGFATRMASFAEKALREGKRHSSWEDPNTSLEQRCDRVVRGWLADATFVAALQRYDEGISAQASLNAIRGLVLRCTAPGSPDVYQGAEYGDYSLVDPDNRRPVDYPARQLSLVSLARTDPWRAFSAVDEAAGSFEFDRAKQGLLHALLNLRRDDPALWLLGSYVPVDVTGGDGRVVAFRRVFGDDQALVIVSIRSDASKRWPQGDDFVGAEISLPILGERVDALSARTVDFATVSAVSEMLAVSPAAVFVAKE